MFASRVNGNLVARYVDVNNRCALHIGMLLSPSVTWFSHVSGSPNRSRMVFAPIPAPYILIGPNAGQSAPASRRRLDGRRYSADEGVSVRWRTESHVTQRKGPPKRACYQAEAGQLFGDESPASSVTRPQFSWDSRAALSCLRLGGLPPYRRRFNCCASN